MVVNWSVYVRSKLDRIRRGKEPMAWKNAVRAKRLRDQTKIVEVPSQSYLLKNYVAHLESTVD